MENYDLIRSALWTGLAGREDEDNLLPLDNFLTPGEVPDVIVRELRADYVDFLAVSGEDVEEYVRTTGCGMGQVEHDFHLTRNGHGAGFWDRGAGEVGERLTEAAKVYGTAELMGSLDDEGNLIPGSLYISN